MQQQQHDRAPPGNEAAGHDSHRETGLKDQQQHLHSGVAATAAQGDAKRFTMLQAKLAQRGFTLQRTIAAVESFARQIGVAK